MLLRFCGRLRAVQNSVEVGVISRRFASGIAHGGMAGWEGSVWRNLAGCGMLHATGRLASQDHPLIALLLEFVGKLHGGNGGVTILGANIDIGLGLITVYNSFGHGDGHIAHVQATHSGNVLDDAVANGVIGVCFRFAANYDEHECTQQRCPKSPFHENASRPGKLRRFRPAPLMVAQSAGNAKRGGHAKMNVPREVYGMPKQMSRRELLACTTVLLPAVWMSPGYLRSMGDTGKAEEEIAAIETHLGGRLGVAALDMGSGWRIEHRADERFPMCSTFKFLLAATILTRVDQNKDKLGRVIRYGQADLLEYAPITKAHVQEGGMTIAALCAAAMEYSDNAAANLLLNVVGGPGEVTAYARSLGDPVTRLDRNEPTLNTAIPGDERDTTTPAAMLEDMKEVLVEKKALSEASRKQLIEWMVENTTGQQRLRAGVPSSWRVGDKTGTGRNGATNDIATAWPPNREPILVTAYFVGSNASYENRDASLANVGRIVAAQFA